MFQVPSRASWPATIISFLELVFHVAVRNIRKTSHSAIAGLIMNILQSILMIMVFYVMFSVLGMKGNAIRGDFMVYTMTGIFMFMAHSKTLAAVSRAEGATASMMKHAPMNTIVSIAAAALASLYQQILSILVILLFYHVVFAPIYIDNPVGALMMLLVSWLSGIGVGMLFKGATPWFPEFFKLFTTVYARANMIASGKMFVANSMPTHLLSWFWWNPLFHVIDQCRGFVFLNYHPRYSSYTYPIVVAAVLMLLGLMLENFTTRRISISWIAGK